MLDIASTIGLAIRFAISAVAVGFMIAWLALAATPILLPLGCLVALTRSSLLRVKGVVLIDWDILRDQLLDAAQIFSFVLITESNGDTTLACTSCTSNAVNIDLGLVG